jgi:hypothetical protein
MRAKCQALNSDASQCRKTGAWVVQFHGDPEFDNYQFGHCSWVRVLLCEHHGSEMYGAKRLK